MSIISVACLYSIVTSGQTLHVQSGISLVSSDNCCVVSNVSVPDLPRRDIALVSWLASPWSNSGYRTMLWNRKRYAELHGYTFLDFNESTLPLGLQDKWETSGALFKPMLLNHVLQHREEGTWVVWNDADTIYTNWSKKWETYLDGDIVVAEAPDVIFNNGVFALRVSDRSRAFIQAWLADNDCCGLEDNGGFVHVVLRSYMEMFNISYRGECKWKNFKKMAKCYRSRLKKLTHKRHVSRAVGPYGTTGNTVQGTPIKGAWGINSGIDFTFPNSWEHGDFILHFAGTGPNTRAKLAIECTRSCSG